MTSTPTDGRRRRIVACVIVVGALGLAVTPASAVVPGSNGRIVFQRSDGGPQNLWAMNADGTGQTPLTTGSASSFAASVSGDGKRIAFISDREQDNREVYVMNADGSGVTRLTHEVADEFTPSLSPDGSRIAFESYRDGSAAIWVMNADGSGLRNLTDNGRPGDYAPTFSPDGSRIAFYSSRDSSSHEIYVMNADGTGQTRLTENADTDYDPAWSPDGRRISFTSERDYGPSEIYVMNADGSGQTRLTVNGDTDETSTFSPDGTKIAFYSHRDRNNEIYVMNADGSNQTNVTRSPVNEGTPEWIAAGPAGAQSGAPRAPSGPAAGRGAASLRNLPKRVRVSSTGRFTYAFSAPPRSRGKVSLRSTRKLRIGTQRRHVRLRAVSFTAPPTSNVKLRFTLSRVDLRVLRRVRVLRFTVLATVDGRATRASLTLNAPAKRR